MKRQQLDGEARKEVIKIPNLLWLKQLVIKKVSKFLDGSDPNYQRKLAVYQSSDNPHLDKDGKIIVTGEHSINGIGYRYSYFKVDEDISMKVLDRWALLIRQFGLGKVLIIKKEHTLYIKKG